MHLLIKKVLSCMERMLPVAQSVRDKAGSQRASGSSPDCRPGVGKWQGDAFLKTCRGALEQDAECSKCMSKAVYHPNTSPLITHMCTLYVQVIKV